MAKIPLYARLLGIKNPVPKRKRKILTKAEKEIDKLEKSKTARTRAVEQATGVASDVEKKKRRVARRARQTLMGK